MGFNDTSLQPHHGSDSHDIPFEVICDRAAASIGRQILPTALPENIDFRNRFGSTRKYATSQLMFALAHTAAAATASFRIWLYPSAFKFGLGQLAIDYRQRGLMVADVTLTFSGTPVAGICPITQQAIVRAPNRTVDTTEFDNSSLRWYMASSESFTYQYNEDIIASLRTPTTAAVNETQTRNMDSATGGTFTLTVTVDGDEQTTAALAYNAADGTIQTALQGLSNTGSGNITFASNVITFTGDLGGREHALVTLDKTLLTGGGGNATVSRTTKGTSHESVLRLDNIRRSFVVAEPYAMSAGTRVLAAHAPWQA